MKKWLGILIVPDDVTDCQTKQHTISVHGLCLLMVFDFMTGLFAMKIGFIQADYQDLT